MNKDKITLAVPSFSGGGAERVIVTLANMFTEWGYSVDLIVGLDAGPYKKLLNIKVNKIVLYSEKSNKIIKILSAIRTIYRYLRKNNSKVLMSSVRELNILIALVHFISGSSTNLFLREAATLEDLLVNQNLTSKVKIFLMRYSYRKSAGLIANSIVTKTDLCSSLNLDSGFVDVIYNPLDINDINSSALSVGNRSSKIKLVACGRLVKNKNFNDLINLVPILKKKFPNLTLEVMGEGKERVHLQQLIDELALYDSVKLVGFVDNPYQNYAEANVFVQTSLWEGFGYVLVEAMACGTPVVAYDSKGAMREILADGKYGILTPVGDLHALADAIIDQIENPTPKEILQEAVKRFDVELIAEQYLKALGVK